MAEFRCQRRNHRGLVQCERDATLQITNVTDGTVRFVCGRHAGEYRRLPSRFTIERVSGYERSR